MTTTARDDHTDQDEIDPLLAPTAGRFVVRSKGRDQELWELYKTAVANFWTAEEFDPTEDLKDWNDTLTDDERRFVKMVLAFFAASDGIVNENLCERFAVEVQLPEARCFYGFQIAMENIHAETYGLLLECYLGSDNAVELDRLFDAIDTIPTVSAKNHWSLAWMDSDAPFAQRIFAFAIVEGVFFSSSFCAIFWLKQRGLMPGLCFTNELISRDENLHCTFAATLYSRLQRRLTREVVVSIMEEAVGIEKRFVTDALPVALVGMSAVRMCEYVEFMADHILRLCGEAPMYHTSNPFKWQNMQGMMGKTNFFEKRNTDYQRPGVLSKLSTSRAAEGEAPALSGGFSIAAKF
jgi:ribonucleotide reductase beta subunit family protein with ferritin-like domain